MASEPPEDAIANFVSFTSTTREQAISFLKANNLDSQKAINAYFEDPTPPDAKATSHYNENNASPFGFLHRADEPRIPATAPPSRPPSRVNMHETSQGDHFETSDGPGPAVTNTGEESPWRDVQWPSADSLWEKDTTGPGQGLSLAQREEQELQQAMAMSLDRGLGQQETGVTTAASEPRFGKATRDYYDEGDWAMTLFNSSSQEVVISPDPEDRKRLDDEPAFIRPTQDNLYLGGFLTIVHEIPLAREALLLRNRVLFDYGHDTQWWNGQAINLPKIVTVHEGQDEDGDWEDIIHETQRLMAFLDSTQRAFGSSEALANLKQIRSTSSDSEEIVARFLETWHGAAMRADPENPLATIFMSQAYKQTPFDEGDEPISKELFAFEPSVEQDHGQTLYDVLDTAIWSDRPGEELDDVWLEHVGEVLVMKLDSMGESKSVDVKVPATFYPDRYLSSCRDLSRDLRNKRLDVQKDVQQLEQLMTRFTTPRSCAGKLSTTELLEKAAAAVPIVLSKSRVNEKDSMNSEVASDRAELVAEKLRAISVKVEAKLKDLDRRKQSAMETMRAYSKALTEPSVNPSEPPLHRYTLRGVCTEPHVTYVLKRNDASNTGDLMEVDGETKSDYQWWRISFSTEDGKTRQAEKREAKGDQTATQHGDVVGYTARKVREIEVLRAAREEWRTVLLVYASDRAMGAKVDMAPPQLQGFVNKDNDAFVGELEEHTNKSNPSDSSQQSNKDAGAQQPSRKGQQVNVFDYEVSEFDNERSGGQEMQEKTESSLLGTITGNAASKSGVSRALDDDSEWNAGSGDERMMDHVESAKAPEA